MGSPSSTMYMYSESPLSIAVGVPPGVVLPVGGPTKHSPEVLEPECPRRQVPVSPGHMQVLKENVAQQGSPQLIMSAGAACQGRSSYVLGQVGAGAGFSVSGIRSSHLG